MAKLKTILAALLPFMVSELCGILFQTAAQEFVEQPAATIDLTADDSIFGALFCRFRKASSDDVIGWVVGTSRITDNTRKNVDAITASLGATAVNQLQASSAEQTGGVTIYNLDFFDVTDVIAGDYKCVLCSTDGNTASPGCGNVLIESNVSAVRVQYEPTDPPVCSPPSSATTRVTLGDSVTLSCASDPGSPMVQLQWLRNSQVINGQPDPVLLNGMLYNNYTFTPDTADSSAEFVCRSTSTTDTKECTASTLTLVSTPQVSVVPSMEAIQPGASGTFRCSATSQTSAVFSYAWTIENIPSSRYTVAADGTSITINSVTVDDHGKSVICDVTDGHQMTGTGMYAILVDGEVVPSGLPPLPTQTQPATTKSLATDPTPTSPPPAPLSLAVIIVLVMVGIILLCIVAGTACFCYRKSKREKAMHIPHTVVKNNLNSNSPHNPEKGFTYPNSDPKSVEPDVIPRGMNERSVDGDAQKWWCESGAPEESSPTLKSVNMPFRDHSQGSKSNLADPYQNHHNPSYDDKVDPADLDFKVGLDERDYSDSGIGYREPTYPGDNGYPEEKYGKSYDDRMYSSDAGYDDQKFDDRGYGDGNQDPYDGDYPDPHGNRPDNYERVYDDDYRSQPEPYSDNNYDTYPDRMPDGSEGYDPAPEGYNDPVPDGYNEGNEPSDYNQPSDYDRPSNYEYDDQSPMDYGYDSRPTDYEDRPSDYDDYRPSDYPPGPVDYHDEPASYNDQYSDQYNDPYYPADRMQDGAPPGDDRYDDGYGNYNENYDDGADYAAPPPPQDLYTPSFIEPQSPSVHSRNEQYDPEDEVSGTSNPSYV